MGRRVGWRAACSLTVSAVRTHFLNVCWVCWVRILALMLLLLLVAKALAEPVEASLAAPRSRSADVRRTTQR